jgi:adenylate kinase
MSRLCLILFGAPGSGKGTQAKLLRQALDLPHISTGDMLRDRIERKDALGLEVAGIIQMGGLVPDEKVNGLVAERIEQPDCERGFILDGYPRTVNQAKILTDVLKAKGIATVVVHLKVDYNVIVSRLAGRRQCPTCGALYSFSANAPTVPVCDYDGSRLVVREDDREEVVTERLKAYDRQTSPVLEYFRNAGFTCLDADGAAPGGPPAVSKKVQALLKEELRRVGNSGASQA